MSSSASHNDTIQLTTQQQAVQSQIPTNKSTKSSTFVHRVKSFTSSQISFITSLSRPIKTLLLIWLVYGLSVSIWTRQILTTFIYELSNGSTKTLGYVETVQGITYLLTMPIAGYITDKFTRLTIIRFDSFLGCILIPIGVSVILFWSTIPNMYVLLSLNAVFQCIQATVLDALLADVTRKGDRDFTYSLKFAIGRLSMGLGPFIVLLMFVFLGDEWKLVEMRIVLTLGVLILSIAVFIQCFGFNGLNLKPNTQCTNSNLEESISESNSDVELKIIELSPTTDTVEKSPPPPSPQQIKKKKVTGKFLFLCIACEYSGIIYSKKNKKPKNKKHETPTATNITACWFFCCWCFNRLCLLFTLLIVNVKVKKIKTKINRIKTKAKVKAQSKIHHRELVSMESDSESDIDDLDSISHSDSEILGQGHVDMQHESVGKNKTNEANKDKNTNVMSTSISVAGVNNKENSDINKNNDEAPTENDIVTNKKCGAKYLWTVPWVMATHAIIIRSGGGMTIKFFVIFFEEQVEFDPIAVCFIWFIVPLLVGIFALFVPKLSQKFGRISVLIIFKSISIVCLFVVAIYANEDKYSVVEKVFISVIFIMRALFIRAILPLEKAIVMDIVAEKNRGKWSSVESLNRSIFTFSAALGGYLIDKYDFQVVFFITAIIYTISVLQIVPIWFVVN